MSDDEIPMSELLPGRVPHELDCGVTIYVDPAVTYEVAEHDARHAKKRGCTCETLTYISDTISEEDRIYRVMYPIHENGCHYALYATRMARRDLQPVEAEDDE